MTGKVAIINGGCSCGRAAAKLFASGSAKGVGAQGARNLLGPAEPVDIAQAALYLASDEWRVTTG